LTTGYYNEHDKFNVEWLKHLMAAGMIAPGEIDGRDIQQVRAEELRGFTQCHFFAGIGVWSYALRLAGWNDTEHVWTGSVPCQPLSCAGQQKGHADQRHLWPAFYRLIAERSPSVVFGEQVASKLGREWFSGVRADLEGVGYACGAADLCSAGFGAPHSRQRLYWCAHSLRTEASGRSSNTAHGSNQRSRTQCDERDMENSAWSPYEWIETIDGRKFRNKPGLPLLAHGIANRVGKLRGYGNALVAPQAEAFIRAYMEIGQ
jgi:DNA (cytosine-5)-methyltransferase 1